MSNCLCPPLKCSTSWTVIIFVKVAQSCLTLQPPWDPMDYGLPGSSVHGIPQARILEWVAIHFSRGIFLTQGLNSGLPHCRWILYRLSHQGSFTSTFSSVLSLSHVRLSVTQWAAACQASLSITYSWSLLKLMSNESVMP